MQVTCEQCGQTDDHPKVHFGGGVSTRTVHFDCMSAAEYEEARGAAQEEGSGPKHTAIVEAARKGVHGDKLREKIQNGSLAQAEGLAYKNGDAA